jgi:phospholipid/cholesterol/gamma-HCH transport system substrate-binding protein
VREVSRAQRARLGIFLIVSGGVLVLLLVLMTGTKFLEKRDKYSIRYRDVSVSGLEVGAQVKYHGVRVGRVDEIQIDPKQIETVVATISLEHGTPIKNDVQAVVSAFSLTGIKIIELTGGSTEAALLKPGSEIPAGQSSFDLITGKAEAVSEKLELVLNNLARLTASENQERVLKAVDNAALVLEDLHYTVADNRDKIDRTFANFEQASQGLVELAQSQALRRAFANLDTTTAALQAAQIGKAITDLQVALQQARTTFTHIDLTLLKGRHDILTSLEVMRESLDSFNEFTRLIAEDPSLLLRGKRAEETSGR